MSSSAIRAGRLRANWSSRRFDLRGEASENPGHHGAQDQEPGNPFLQGPVEQPRRRRSYLGARRRAEGSPSRSLRQFFRISGSRFRLRGVGLWGGKAGGKCIGEKVVRRRKGEWGRGRQGECGKIGGK